MFFLIKLDPFGTTCNKSLDDFDVDNVTMMTSNSRSIYKLPCYLYKQVKVSHSQTWLMSCGHTSLGLSENI